MIVFEKIHHSNIKCSIKTVFVVLFFFSVTNTRIANSSTISKHLLNQDVSSFCVHEKCTVVFPNGTSATLALTEFYRFIMQYVGRTSNTDDITVNLESDTNKSNKKENSTAENERTISHMIGFNSGAIDNITTIPSANDSATFGDTVEEDVTSHTSPLNSTSPSNVTNVTEQAPTCVCSVCDEINQFDDANETESQIETSFFQVEENFISFISEQEHKIDSRSVLEVEHGIRSDNAEEFDQNEGGFVLVDKSNDQISRSDIVTEIDYDYEEKQFVTEEPIIQPTEEEMEEAKKMTECARKKTEYGIVCVCNRTYCDTFMPPERTPKWVYTWYTSSEEGHRFRKLRNDFIPYKGDEDGAFYVNTSRKYQTIFGFGGGFTDTACKLIKDLRKETRKRLLQSYFGPFGIGYTFGRVPIGGTDFSPRFYTYMDHKDESINTFMLTEQDFKYKIPIILETIELNNNQLKLIGSAWTAPPWMKSVPSQFHGTLKREYWPLWAQYHIKFLDQYLRNGIKFWALTTGNEPLNYYYITSPPYINAMEWSPYEQSQWVAYHLHPMLQNSSHSDILILGLDENREYVTSFMKLFFEDYHKKSFDDPTYFHKSKVVDVVAGIAIHGYMDYDSNLEYLDQTMQMYPDKFLLYTETCCLGSPHTGEWKCGEVYSIAIIQSLNQWVSGWIDWNIAVNLKGGPTYVHNELHSPILVNVKQDEFYKEAMYYVMGHFSLFLLPNSKRIEVTHPKQFERIHAAAVHRTDDGKVIVFYNGYDVEKQVTFLIDKKYKLSLKAPANSINSVLFW